MAQEATDSLLSDHELVLLAEFAAESQQWSELRGLGQRLCAEYPQSPQGPVFAAWAAREEGDLDAAEELLVVAAARFPDASEVAIAHAWIAIHREDWPAAERRWGQIREREPHNLSAYLWAAFAFRREEHYAQAQKLLEQAIVLFPEEAQPAVDYAWTALEQRDYPAAKARYEYLHQTFPDEPMGLIGSGAALTYLHRFEEADELLAAAKAAYPDRVDAAIHYAHVAQEGRNWAEALRRFSDGRRDFPADPHLALGVAIALIHLGQPAAAAQELEAARNAFPDDVAIAIEHAVVAATNGDWTESERRWEALRRVFPDHPAVRARFEDALMARQAEAVLETGADPLGASSVAATDALSLSDLARGLSERPHDPQLQRELMTRFESLGDNCELGLVQRHFGAEPLGLFRWAGITPDYLALALRSRMEGLGDLRNTQVELFHGPEYFVKDKRGWFEMHTFIREGQVPYQRIFEQQMRRLQFLSRKLIEDLTEARKIFVYKERHGRVEDAEIQRIHTAIRGYGDVTLLIVRLADEEHPNGSVVVQPDGLLLGYLARVSKNAVREEIDYDSWYKLCLNAISAVSGVGAVGVVPDDYVWAAP